MSEKYRQLKVKELQDMLSKKGLSQTGKKEDLIERLVAFDKRKELEKLEKELDFDDNVYSNSVDLLKESVLSDDEDLLLDNKQEEQPKTVENGPFQFTPITFEKSQVGKPQENRIKTDAQRRLERMKRFGVKATEEEMKELRAARFGTTVALKDPKRQKARIQKSTSLNPIAAYIQKKTKQVNHSKKPLANQKRLNQKKRDLGKVAAQIHQKNNRFISTVNPNHQIVKNRPKIPAAKHGGRHVQINNGKRMIYIQQDNTR